MPEGRLRLTEALKTARLDEFAAQAEAEGAGPVVEADFDNAVHSETIEDAPQPRPERDRSAIPRGSRVAASG
jgi:hypothetical protein